MDLREIRQLIRLLAGTDIAEIEVREEAQTIRITRQLVGKGEPSYAHQPVVTYVPSPPVSFPAAPVGGEGGYMASQRGDEGTPGKTVTISSPMVGTYYQANSPDAPPLVARGDVVKKGQVVCIIEAMKLMNEIEAEYAGRIVSILKENASPVEYGEPLFVIEPA